MISEIIIVSSGQAVSDCTGVPDGDYHSSGNCNAYVTCTAGVLADSTCPAGEFWDDDTDACGSTTNTCEDACSIGPCSNGGTCAYSGESYECTCPTAVTGSNCETGLIWLLLNSYTNLFLLRNTFSHIQ